MTRTTLPLLLALQMLGAAPRTGFTTRLGGTGSEWMAGMVMGADGSIYVAGTTTSVDFQANALQARPFQSNLYRVDRAASRPVYSLPPAVNSISPDRQHPGTLWAGTSQGLFNSIDTGATWTRVAGGLPQDSAISIAVDPTNGAILYAAAGGRAYKSTDGGATWAVLPLDEPDGIRGLAVDPTQPSTVFAALNYYNYVRSTDGGLSWSRVASFPLAFDPRQPGVLYGPWARSTDHGLTWTAATGEMSQILFSSIAVDPIRPGLVLAASPNGTPALFRSLDAGGTWSKLNVPGAVWWVAADPVLPLYYALSTEGLLRSSDGFFTWTLEPATWAPMNGSSLSVGAPVGAGQPAPVFAQTSKIPEAFAAKLDGDGNLVAATYLGGPHGAQALMAALDPSGALWVLGWDYAGSPSAAIGLWKLSPGLDRLEKTIAFPPFDGRGSVSPVSLAVNSSGTPQVLVRRTETYCWQQDDVHPPHCYIVSDDARLYTVDPSGSQPPEARYVGSYLPNVVLANPRGGLYVAAGPAIGKLRPAGGFDFATALFGSTIQAVTLDSDGNLILSGNATCAADFYTTGGVFQPHSGEKVSWPTHAFVAKMNGQNGSILYSTCLGGEASDSATAVAVDAAGRPVVAGVTWSHDFPMRAPLTGGFPVSSAFVSKFDAGVGDLLFSSFLSGAPRLGVKGLGVDRAGNIVVGGDTGADVLVMRIDDAAAGAVRIESVVNAASGASGPLVPGERIRVNTQGVPAGARVLLDGAPLPALTSGPDSITVMMPDDIDSRAEAAVTVEFDGGRTSPVAMPAGAYAPGLYTVDGSGAGQALVRNEDGTTNSADNPAAQNSVITIPINGAGRMEFVNGSAVPGTPIKVFVRNWYCKGVDAQVLAWRELDEDVLQIKVYVPDFPFQTSQVVQLRVEMGEMVSQLGATIAAKP